MSPANKIELRRSLIQKRRSLSSMEWQAKSDRICKHLQSFSPYQEAKTVLAYFSFRQEPDLSFLFTSQQHRWGFPRCVGKFLIWHLWQPGEKLAQGKFGILEPASDAPTLSAKDVDLILVPAVAIDGQGYRLGYGGGFYDHLLSKPRWENILTVGIIFEFAYVPKLPNDIWDIKLQYICTNKALYSC